MLTGRVAHVRRSRTIFLCFGDWAGVGEDRQRKNEGERDDFRIHDEDDLQEQDEAELLTVED